MSAMFSDTEKNVQALSLCFRFSAERESRERKTRGEIDRKGRGILALITTRIP